ncbi:uncharacterized protein LOC128740371 [Sabethes cyaneus]|uniref:uncharacterized protein LOC128740371 n=1 Tax=Sabethes cyaneus TaxID=53552 RepID=UPI00237E408B|nr:uncharacterized protein LOC128740371 [Sabethes cyaneus]
MSASESEQESSEAESPVIKTRPVPRQQSSESGEESDEDADHEDTAEEDENDESDEQEEIEEKQKDMQAKSVSSKTKGGPVNPPKAFKPAATVVAMQHPKYDKMVEEAVKELVENQRTGTSIYKVMKFIENKYSVPEAKAKLFCKKAIQKGLKNETYVKTSGIGLTGSIGFSASFKKKIKSEQAKLLKPKKPTTSQVKAKAKPQPKSEKETVTKKKAPSRKAEPKTKESAKLKKDTKKNAATKAGSKNDKSKAKISKTGKVRLSINSMIVPQPKLKGTVKSKSAGAGQGKKKTETVKSAAGPSKNKITAPKAKVQPSRTKAANKKA